VAFFDERGRLIAPAGAAALSSDGPGLASARAGAPPHAKVRGEEDDARVVAYAPIPGGALRATFAVDRAVEATLERSRLTLWLLGFLDGLILLVAASLILRNVVVRPVADLERAARRVAAGDLGARAEVRGPGELAALADAFDRMTESLRTGRESLIRSEKLAGIGRLAAGVAHEVGNPLAAVLGYVETLLTDTPDKPIDPALRRDILERVRGETQRIHRIVQELLEYSRARPHAGEPEPESVDVKKAVDAALSLARASTRLRGVDTRVELPEDLPPARATIGRLTQVLLNLVVNAADAMEGEGTLVLSGRRADGRVVVAVSDAGPGVPAEHRDKIFDPFFTTKPPGAGTGLGLSVSLAIAESFGGTLRLVDSQAGASFEVELPAA
jgi:signal transduction histidine kinase